MIDRHGYIDRYIDKYIDIWLGALEMLKLHFRSHLRIDKILTDTVWSLEEVWRGRDSLHNSL